MEKSKIVTNTFPVAGMSCASCAVRVDKALNGLPETGVRFPIGVSVVNDRARVTLEVCKHSADLPLRRGWTTVRGSALPGR